MKTFNRSVKLSGSKRVINGVTVQVLELDKDGNILLCTGVTVPTADSAGFSKEGQFIDTDAVDGARGLYSNIGTTALCDFNIVGDTGYTAGDGGAVTQITTASTGVTLSKLSGQITTVALTTAAAAEEVFTVTNTLVNASDVVVVSTTYAGAGTIVVSTKKTVSGAFDVVIANLHASAALNAVVVVNFAIIRAVAA